MSDTDLSQRLASFRNSLKIDGNNLGGECLGQAVLYEQIGLLVADIKRTARAAKDTMEFTAARLKKEARANPGQFGIAKTTESALEEAVKVHNEYRGVQEKYAEAQYLADCAGVLLMAAEQRKSMLKDSVSMQIHELYSAQHDLSKDQNRLSGAQGDVNEADINNVRRAVAAAREEEEKQEDIDVGG